jgi:hypothetical protein
MNPARFLVKALLTWGALLAVGCTTVRYNVPIAKQEFRASELNRAQYSVTDVEATACRSGVGFWPIPFWVTWGENGFSLWGWVWNADDDAIQKAFKQTSADGMIAPRVQMNDDEYIWYSHCCYTIKGKAVRVLTDSELAEKGAGALPKIAPAQ